MHALNASALAAGFARARSRAVVAAVLACAVGCSDATQAATGADAGADAVVDVSFAGQPLDAKVADQSAADVLTDATEDAGADAGQNPADAGPDTGKKPGFNYECKPLTVESCVTACGSAGLRKCLKEWGPCFPPDEFCGNCDDDNCNGLINEGCPPNPTCGPSKKPCPVALISIAEGASVGAGSVLHLASAGSFAQGTAKIAQWAWSVQAPAGAAGQFIPSAAVAAPTFAADVAGQYLFTLEVWDDQGVKSCAPAVAKASAAPNPPLQAENGCADGTREGFVDQAQWPQIAGCAGAWDQPGVTPDSVVATCNHQGGNSGPKADGSGCSSADLCAPGWHVCKGWQDVAQKSQTGCAGASPPDAPPKSLFFAIRQPSANGSQCGAWGDGVNDVFGCGNLGTALGADKGCGPLDRVLASTQPNSCGFNEAEPNLGPWQCLGVGKSDLQEGANVTKKACQGKSCSYDGAALGPSDKGGVLCCHGNDTP